MTTSCSVLLYVHYDKTDDCQFWPVTSVCTASVSKGRLTCVHVVPMGSGSGLWRAILRYGWVGQYEPLPAWTMRLERHVHNLSFGVYWFTQLRGEIFNVITYVTHGIQNKIRSQKDPTVASQCSIIMWIKRVLYTDYNLCYSQHLFVNYITTWYLRYNAIQCDLMPSLRLYKKNGNFM